MKKLDKNIKKKMRFGVICTGFSFKAWQVKCIQKLIAMESVELVLIIIICNDHLHKSNKTTKLWDLYYYSFVNRRSRSMRETNMSDALKEIPVIRCNVHEDKQFSTEDIIECKKYNLDFILHNEADMIYGDILDVPLYGVWSIHHSDTEKYRGAYPCFWEIYNNDSVIGVVLWRHFDHLDGGIILKQGYLKTIKTSYWRNLDNILFECADWPAQMCADIQNGNKEIFRSAHIRNLAHVCDGPNNLQLMKFILLLTKNKLTTLYKKIFFYDIWNIGIIDKPIHAFLQSGDCSEVKWLSVKRKNKYIADPFALSFDNKEVILFEEYNIKSLKGYISAMNINGDETHEYHDLFKNSFHMSYPYMIEYQGKIYCIPETAEANEVSLYVAEEFPLKWTKASVLIENFKGVDNTIIQYNEIWWLFATKYDSSEYHKLYIWYAYSLFGSWKPHAGNPVKIDVRSARPAGTPFIYNQSLYRPAQDCSEEYGKRIVLNRITSLTPTEFSEECVSIIKPYQNSPYPDGLHTISSFGNKTVIDSKKHESVWSSFHAVCYKMKMLKKY